MYCKYCGHPIPEGGVCSCPMAKKIQLQNTQYQTGPVGNQRQTGQTGNPYQTGRTGNPRQTGQTGNPYQTGRTGNPRQTGPAGNPYQNPNRSKTDHGKIFFVISIALSVIAALVFVLLRFAIVDFMMESDISDAYQYLMYIVPVVISIAACLFAVFSLQDKKIRILSVIALAAAVIVTGAVIVSMAVFPYEADVTVSSDDDDRENDEDDIIDKKDDDQKIDREEDTKNREKESESSGEDNTASDISRLKADYEEGKLDYVQVCKEVKRLEKEKLTISDANTVAGIREKAESDLEKEIDSLADENEYIEAYKKLTNIEEQLQGDAFAAGLKEKHLSDFMAYLDRQSKALAQEGKAEEAVVMLEEAMKYLADSSGVQRLIDEVEAIASGADDYILPESNSRYLTKADVEGLSLREINYAKNEIYARHGRRFNSKELQDYFDSKSWYNGTISPDKFNTSVFNQYELKNAEFLRDIEFSMDSRGYQLDAN